MTSTSTSSRIYLIGIATSICVLGIATFVFAVAWGGGVISVVKIDDSTSNGPVLADSNSYGESVANIGDLDGNGVNDILAGTKFSSAIATNQGQAHLSFLNANGSVISTVALNGATTNGATLTGADGYGMSVAGLGDLNGDGVEDILVGSHAADATTLDDGKVNIHFMNTDGSMDSTVAITAATTNGPSTVTTQNYYGGSAANIGDLNGDGVIDIAVGGVYCGTGWRRGAIFIHFMNTNGSLDATAQIDSATTNGPTAAIDQDEYGTSIAALGDLNGDGVTEIAVGVPKDDTGGSNRGTVYIHFMNTDGSIDSTVEINSSTTNGPTLINSDGFGVRLAGVGDLDADGVEDIAVGANGDDTGGSARGTVYIIYLNSDGSVKSFDEINSTTTNGPTLINSDQFAYVANMGDMDGNGFIDLAVGALGDDTGGSARGAIHMVYLGDESAGITLTGTSSLAVTEGSTTDTFTMVLDSAPSSNVTIALASSGGDLSFSADSFVFTSANYATTQTGTVTAINDSIAEGTHTDYINFTVTSSDGNYNAYSIHPAAATITDNDTAGVTRSDSSLEAAEGSADSFTVVLNTQPTSTVTVALASSGGDISFNSSSLSFTTSNWSTAQTVTATANDDPFVEGSPHTDYINFTLTSSDAYYNALSVTPVSMSITDNDVYGVSREEGSEGGGSRRESSGVIPGVIGSSEHTSAEAEEEDFPTCEEHAAPESPAERDGHLLHNELVFSDVEIDTWFAPYIGDLLRQGIVSGYLDAEGNPLGEFRPAGDVTIAEVIKMALAAFVSDPTSDDTPKNISAQNTWAASYIALAEELHFTFMDSSFDVHAPASRALAIQILTEVAGMEMTQQYQGFYEDVSSETEFVQAIETATRLCWIHGDTDEDGELLGIFRPLDPLNRAEVSKILSIILE